MAQLDHEARVTKLKCRLHDVGHREHLMMIGAKAADVHLHEFPELSDFFPHLLLNAQSCRAALVRFLFCRSLHYSLILLLVIDVILVMGGLQLKIEVVALQGMAIGTCFSTSLQSNSSDAHGHHFHDVHDGLHCVHEQATFQTAEVFERVDQVLIVISISILCIFLIENLLFIVAFRWNYFTIAFFPFDLLVVILSLGTEILSLSAPSLEALENPLETMGGRASVSSGVSPLIAILVLGRFWRFIRIGHAVYLLQGSEEHEETLKMQYEKTMSHLPDESDRDRDPSGLPHTPHTPGGVIPLIYAVKLEQRKND